MAMTKKSKISIFVACAAIVLVIVLVKIFSKDGDETAATTTKISPVSTTTTTEEQPASTTTTPEEPLRRTSRPVTLENCQTIMSFDAATYINGTLFMFKGTQFRKIGETSNLTFSVRDGWNISGDFDKLDAVYETPDKEIWIFIGDQIHIFYRNSFNETKSLRNDFGIHKNKIDAIFQSPEDQETYIISDNKQWKLDESEDSFASPIKEEWREAFDLGMDAVFREDDNLVFLKEDDYYVFNSKTKTLGLPMPIGPKYFNCESADNRAFEINPRIGK